MSITAVIFLKRNEMHVLVPFNAKPWRDSQSDPLVMADFPSNPEWIGLLLMMPLAAALFFVIATVAVLLTLLRGNAKAPRARPVAFRALTLSVMSAAFPTVPLALKQAGVDVDYDWIVRLLWFSLIFMVLGACWLPRPPKWTRHRMVWIARRGRWWLGRPADQGPPSL